jgi:predicted dehydrogenase
LTAATATKPRLGFLGVGWIGRMRLDALARAGAAEVAAVFDPAGADVPGATAVGSLDELLASELDGVVIATPSALHAEQAIEALDRGLPVFCQKPLALTAVETREVVEAARRADRLLRVDFCYRELDAARRLKEIVDAGALGRVFAADLVFHNAYGPDKSWFYDVAQAGGGCVIDLGIHLVDLALWLLGFPRVEGVASRLFSGGRPLEAGERVGEDYALADVRLDGGAMVRLACSWRAHAGRDCEISATFYGTDGAVSLRNVDGSFYDFVGERLMGTTAELLSSPPDDWGGRAAVAWATRVAAGGRFDPCAEQYVRVAEVVDRIYGRAP